MITQQIVHCLVDFQCLLEKIVGIVLELKLRKLYVQDPGHWIDILVSSESLRVGHSRSLPCAFLN